MYTNLCDNWLPPLDVTQAYEGMETLLEKLESLSNA